MSDDRTVHGRTMSGEWQIVRYNRAGKWYIEHEQDGRRVRVTVAHAARLAALGVFYPRRPGGQAFDAKVRHFRRTISDSSAVAPKDLSGLSGWRSGSRRRDTVSARAVIREALNHCADMAHAEGYSGVKEIAENALTLLDGCTVLSADDAEKVRAALQASERAMSGRHYVSNGQIRAREALAILEAGGGDV